MKATEKKQACTQHRYEVTNANLPVCCPPLDSRVWDAHPRVYLPIKNTGRAVCPYCEAEFIVVDKEKDSELENE